MSYRVGPTAIAENIRRTLEEVRGFRLVNELLQNADDSGANHFVLGVAPNGIKGAVHPLLQIPAVYCANDGGFTERDARAIHQLHASGKADDVESVGKFGLGLKAAHELCEAFFYVGVTKGVGNGTNVEAIRAGALSPWILGHDYGRDYSDSSLRPDWEGFPSGNPARPDQPADDKLILSFVREKVHWKRVSFVLWIPLRREDHTQRPNGERVLIRPKYFGGNAKPYPDDLFSEESRENLALAMPLLKSINEAQFLGPTSHATFAASLESASIRRTYPKAPGTQSGASPNRSSLLPRNVTRLKGRVEVTDQGLWQYVGCEWAVHDLLNWSDRTDWPTTANAAASTGRSQVRDKTLPHVATVLAWTGADNERGTLSLGWSTFLPLGVVPERHALTADIDVILNLHGYFFLNPDRASVRERRDKNSTPGDEPIEVTWNDRLKREGTLRLVLSTVDDFATAIQGREGASRYIEALTLGISQTELFRDPKNRKDICHQHNWLWTLQPGGGPNWSLVPTGKTVLACPSLEDLTSLVPSIATVVGSQSVVTSLDKPRLSRSAPIEQWPSGLLDAVLQQVDMSFVSTTEGIQALRNFLSMSVPNKSMSDPSAHVLVRVLRQALQASTRDPLWEVEKEFKELVAFVPEEKRFPIPDGTPPEVMECLLGAEINVVAYPARLGIAAQTRLSPDVARIVLSLGQAHRVTNLALAALQAVDNPIRLLKSPEFIDSELIPITVRGAFRYESFSSINQAARENRLFARPTRNHASLTSLLQDCLPESDLLEIDSTWSRALGLRPLGNDAVGVCRL